MCVCCIGFMFYFMNLFNGYLFANAMIKFKEKEVQFTNDGCLNHISGRVKETRQMTEVLKEK